MNDKVHINSNCTKLVFHSLLVEQLVSCLALGRNKLCKNSRPNTQTIQSNRCIPCNKTDTNLESRPTQYTLSFGASPPDSGRWEVGIDTPQLPTSGCCSSTGKWLHLLPPTAPWSLLRAPLPAKSWRWRRQTEPGSSLWVREVERYKRDWERERESRVCVATWCSL